MEEFILAHNWKVDYVMAGKAWWPAHKAAGHMTTAIKKEKTQEPVLLFIQSGTMCQVVVVSSVRVACHSLDRASAVALAFVF